MLSDVPDEIRLSRARLISMLDTAAPFAADSACREALIEGANYRIYAGAVGREALIQIYKTRVYAAQARGVANLGAHEALGRLATCPLSHLIIGAVSGDWEYALFLTPDAVAVAACLGMASHPM